MNQVSIYREKKIMNFGIILFFKKINLQRNN